MVLKSMPAKVKLKDIVEELEMLFDERLAFVNLDTGEVTSVSTELLQMAEEETDSDDEEPDLLQSEEAEWEIAKEIVSSGRYRKLPTKYEVNEWEIMQEFTNSLESAKIRDDLQRAIHGSGAFQYFKDTIRRYYIEKDWYDFRTEALTEIAREWCEENDLAFE